MARPKKNPKDTTDYYGMATEYRRRRRERWDRLFGPGVTLDQPTAGPIEVPGHALGLPGDYGRYRVYLDGSVEQITLWRRTE